MNEVLNTLTRFFKATLTFLNLLDREGKLSLTNIVLLAMTVKVCIAPTVSATEAVTLFLALANYAHKRAENAKALVTSDNEATELEAIKKQLTDLTSVATSVEELQKRVSKVQVKLGLGS